MTASESLSMTEIRDKLRCFFDKHGNVELVLLFGSYSRGTAGDFSDVDIAVLFTEQPHILVLGSLIQAISELVGKKIDFVELRGLEAEDPRRAYEIASNSKVILERSSTAAADFRTRAFLAYFDAQPLLESAATALRVRLESGDFGRPVHA
ncbi:MAG: nucleotidyltransferase domain-containing protein [Spirochaetes bacterium]|nr:nucleotidyltransferase domain-containing protein [Spirochaetota bacterium]